MFRWAGAQIEGDQTKGLPGPADFAKLVGAGVNRRCFARSLRVCRMEQNIAWEPELRSREGERPAARGRIAAARRNPRALILRWLADFLIGPGSCPAGRRTGPASGRRSPASEFGFRSNPVPEMTDFTCRWKAKTVCKKSGRCASPGHAVFLSDCLPVPWRHKLRAFAPGRPPRAVWGKFARRPMRDGHFPPPPPVASGFSAASPNRKPRKPSSWINAHSHYRHRLPPNQIKRNTPHTRGHGTSKGRPDL